MTVPWEQRKGDPIILAEVNFRWTWKFPQKFRHTVIFARLVNQLFSVQFAPRLLVPFASKSVKRAVVITSEK